MPGGEERDGGCLCDISWHDSRLCHVHAKLCPNSLSLYRCQQEKVFHLLETIIGRQAGGVLLETQLLEKDIGSGFRLQVLHTEAAQKLHGVICSDCFRRVHTFSQMR